MNAESLEISFTPAVNSMCAHAHTHTALIHRGVNRWASKQSTVKHTCVHRHTWTQTHSYTHTHSLLCPFQTHSLLHATVKRLHIFYASSNDLSSRHLPVKISSPENSETIQLAFLWTVLCADRLLTFLFKKASCRFYGINHLWRQRLCEWDCWCETTSFIHL